MLDDPVLPYNVVHIWAIALDLTPEQLVDIHHILSPDEIARAARLRFDQDRNRWIAGRGQLRHILSRYLRRQPSAIIFCYDCICGEATCMHFFRKPSLIENSWLQFNISHSGDYALIAVTCNRSIGIDLERRRAESALLPMASVICTPAELTYLHNFSPPVQAILLLNVWTRKEAYLKARGIGLFLSPQKINMTLTPGERPRLVDVNGDPTEASRWTIDDIPFNPHYAAAVAVEGNPVPKHLRRYIMHNPTR